MAGCLRNSIFFSLKRCLHFFPAGRETFAQYYPVHTPFLWPGGEHRGQGSAGFSASQPACPSWGWKRTKGPSSHRLSWGEDGRGQTSRRPPAGRPRDLVLCSGRRSAACQFTVRTVNAVGAGFSSHDRGALSPWAALARGAEPSAAGWVPDGIAGLHSPNACPLEDAFPEHLCSGELGRRG